MTSAADAAATTTPGEPAAARGWSRRKRYIVAAILAVLGVVLIGSAVTRMNDSAADARFVAAIRADDDQAWVAGMSDQALAKSGRQECDLMRAGADPQARIDFYTDFNGAYLVNDAMAYLCTDVQNR